MPERLELRDESPAGGAALRRERSESIDAAQKDTMADPHLWGRWFAVGMLGSLAAACGRDAVSACDGAARHGVANTGAGHWEARRLEPRLVELWRAGAPDAAPRLGYPASIAVSPAGRAAVADFELDEVFVFSHDGTPLGSWPQGHSLEKPVAVSWGEDERLHILDLVASALLTTDSQGNLLRRQPISERFLATVMEDGGLDWAGVLPNGSVYFQPMAALDPEAADPGASTWTLWRQAAGSVRIDTIARAPARLFGYTLRARTAIPSWPRLRAATGGAGLLAVGGEDGAYRIRIYDSNEEPVRTVCRDASPLPLTAAERGDVESEVDSELLREAPRPSTPAAFGHFFLSTEGRLFVQRDRPFVVTADPYTAVHGNQGGLFDVFDEEGRYLGELRAPAGVRLRAARGGRVWGLENPESGGVQLVAYELSVSEETAR
jgi:hypothetical protein